jgi:mRNA-degrading endonuclease toxin of MazEF toxin-antitoxin module
MKRGEIWLADFGYAGKVRPVLIVSVEPSYEDRALVTYVIRTTSVRGLSTKFPIMLAG